MNFRYKDRLIVLQAKYFLWFDFFFCFRQSIKIKIVWKTGTWTWLSRRRFSWLFLLFCNFLWFDWINVNLSGNFFIRFTLFLFFIIVKSKKVTTLKWRYFNFPISLNMLYLHIDQVLYLFVRRLFLIVEKVNWVSDLAYKRSLIK